jgi:hypothetical protein
MSARCEPPEEFRWKEGRHWLRLGAHDNLDTGAAGHNTCRAATLAGRVTL